MGIFDNIKGPCAWERQERPAHDARRRERELTGVVACTVKAGGRPWVGGDLVLTDHRLLFTPLNVKDVAALLSYGLKKAGAPGAPITAVGWVAGQVMLRPSDGRLADPSSPCPGRSF